MLKDATFNKIEEIILKFKYNNASIESTVKNILLIKNKKLYASFEDTLRCPIDGTKYQTLIENLVGYKFHKIYKTDIIKFILSWLNSVAN